MRVKATGLATYPDVTVVCGLLELDREDKDAVVNPVVLVEVLSRNTEAYDRGEKWAQYRRIESLQAYLLVDQIRPRVEIYERAGADAFLHRVVESGTLMIRPLEIGLDVDALYAANAVIEG